MTGFNRRRFIGLSAAGFAAAGFTGLGVGRAMAQGAAPQPYLAAPKLGYAFNALEPHIDARTMEIHSTRHHQAFITNLNDLMGKNPQLAAKAPHEILADLNSVPEAVRTAVRNNLGGHANHTMFWEIMGPNGGQPSGEVLAAITADLGGVDKMKEAFNGAGMRQFGSGWVFITVNKDGKLAITSKPNQDSPLMDGQRVLLGNDVWEHAYYLTYQNRRADYLASWWNTVNWSAVANRYARAKKGELTI
jgi:Fe-Mn family superoxide dismutase